MWTWAYNLPYPRFLSHHDNETPKNHNCNISIFHSHSGSQTLDGTGDPVECFSPVFTCVCVCVYSMYACKCVCMKARLCLHLWVCLPDSIIHHFQCKYGLAFLCLFFFFSSSFVYYLLCRDSQCLGRIESRIAIMSLRGCYNYVQMQIQEKVLAECCRVPGAG